MSNKKQPSDGGRKPPKADVAARVLADADIMGVRAASKKHNIPERSIRRWRTKSENSAENANSEAWKDVADTVRSTRALIADRWQDSIDTRISRVLLEADRYLDGTAKPVNAQMLQSLVMLLKQLSELRVSPDVSTGSAGVVLKVTLLDTSKPEGT